MATLKDILTKKTTSETVRFGVSGLSELGEKLKALDAVGQTKALRLALRKASKPIVDAAQAAAPVADAPYKRYKTSAKRGKNGAKIRNKRGTAPFTLAQPGTLRNSIKAFMPPQRLRSDAEAELAIRPKKTKNGDPFYWYFVEYGTKKMPAAPYLHRSFDAQHQKALGIFVLELGKNIDRAIAKQALIME